MKDKKLVFLFLSGLWVVTTGSGLMALWNYESTPGRPANPLPHWPADSGIRPEPGRYVLVMFVHPHCPCSRASMGQLAKILTHTGDRVSTYIVFVKPAGATEGWEDADLWRSASAIPGAHLVLDDRGSEARRFEAATSGQTFLYNETGSLLFRGGITGARGHAGDNPGQASVIAMVNHKISETASTPVFGCPLFNDACKHCSVMK